jgi:transcriptional antiterminator RfaH
MIMSGAVTHLMSDDGKGPVLSALTRPLGQHERWYVAQTLSRREFNAEMQIEAQGFRTFLPSLMKTVRHARRTRMVKAAVFPGYLFVALDSRRDRWRSINGTFGVARLLTAGDGGPLPVPAGVVESLFGYLDESGLCSFERDLVVGQNVRVLVGPLAQAVGQLVRLDGKGRVRVLLEILGGQVHVTINKSSLEAA